MAVVGIDLGTTYSAVATLDEMKKPLVLLNTDGGNYTPSVVFFESEKNIVVGEHAKNTSEVYPERVAQFVKNDMGSDRTWKFFGKAYRPEEISAMILQKLKQDAEAVLEKPITGAVITVPAIFGEAQRNATRDAAKIAGLEVIAILEEPVAAALNYGLARAGGIKETQNILVYDLGGGTFDVTIMRVSENSVTMLYTGGDRRLGGKLWDDEIMGYVATRFAERHGADPRDGPDSRQSLRLAAENAKRQLTQKEKAAIKCDHAGNTERVELTREQFDELTAHLLKRTETACDLAVAELVEKGDLSGWDDIHQVLLVGGSSKMPQVTKMMQRLSGREPKLHEPDLAVAKGAALFSEMELLRVAQLTGDAANLQRHGIGAHDAALLPKTKVTRVCSFALGNKCLKSRSTDEYVNEVLIQKNTTLPAKGKGTFYTIRPDQRSVEIIVLEGDDPDPERCIELGKGVITGIPSGLPDESPVEVTFELTDESVIRVTAIETMHDTRCDFELKRKTGQTAMDIRQAADDLARKTIE